MKYEYKWLRATDEEFDLDILGEEGWELVAVSVLRDEEIFYFKRPLT